MVYSPEATAWLKHSNLEKYNCEEAAYTVRLQTRFCIEQLFEYAFFMCVRIVSGGLLLLISQILCEKMLNSLKNFLRKLLKII